MPRFSSILLQSYRNYQRTWGTREQQDSSLPASSPRITQHFPVEPIKTWWNHLRGKSSPMSTATAGSGSSNSGSSSTTGMPQIRDWRSLSPSEPPLPNIGVSPSDLPSDTPPRRLHGRRSKVSALGRAVRFSSMPTLDSASQHQSFPSAVPGISVVDKTIRALYTIFEESDTVMTDSTQSFQQNTHPSPRQSEEGKRKRLSSGASSIASNASNPAHTESNLNPTPKSPLPSPRSPETPPSSTAPPFPATTSPPPALIGDEVQCRRKFARMVRTALRFRNEHQAKLPHQMEIVFNDDDHVDSVILTYRDYQERHKFCGNAQYIPPELTTHGRYHCAVADVWVLGVSLYRMLVGKYPFAASNDKALFKKMLHGDFSIPPELSEDVKDLLRRMLAPDTTRASLDLVIHHPWLKPHTFSPSIPKSHLSDFVSNTPHAANDALVGVPASHPAHAPGSPQKSPPPPPTATATATFVHSAKSHSTLTRTLTHLVLLVVDGPYRPPKHPYRELAPLGGPQ